jgi:Tfp pilus assembly protein PilN
VKPVNLIPHEQRRRLPSQGSGKGAYLVVGVLTALLAMVVVYVLASNQVTERQNQTAAASAEADRLEAQAAKASTYTDFAAIAETRLQSVAAVAQTRFDWERFMRELSLITPEGAWLRSTDASVTGESATEGASATASTATSTAAPAAPAANLVGCTPRQSDVARMMVRLRQLHRVSDVALNESLVEQSAQPPTVDSCGSFYKFDLVVTFDPTMPATEAPRGAARVPASLGGGS